MLAVMKPEFERRQCNIVGLAVDKRAYCPRTRHGLSNHFLCHTLSRCVSPHFCAPVWYSSGITCKVD